MAQAVIMEDGTIQAGEIHPELVEFYPVQAVLTDDTEIGDALAFYEMHAHYGLRFPRDPRWIRSNLGVDFFLFGIRINGELIAVAWIANKKDFVYFSIENDCLVLKNNGAWVDSGGWCIRPDYRGKGLFHLLTATVTSFWFTWINRGDARPLWGRMMGAKDADNNPLFWNRVGAEITGLPYRELIRLPFGAMEEAIFACWPRVPMSLNDIPEEVVKQALGKSLDVLVGPKNGFVRWGLTEVTDRYVPTSLNHFVCATRDSIGNPAKFFRDAFSDAVKKVNGF